MRMLLAVLVFISTLPGEVCAHTIQDGTSYLEFELVEEQDSNSTIPKEILEIIYQECSNIWGISCAAVRKELLKGTIGVIPVFSGKIYQIVVYSQFKAEGVLVLSGGDPIIIYTDDF